MKITLYFIFCVAMLLLVSCDPLRVYEKNVEIEKQQWFKDSLVILDFDIPDIQSAYNIYYNIRNASTYPYHNLYITYTLTDSTGQMLETELIDHNLFDPKIGTPLGTSGLGDIFDHQFLILENYRFNYQGRYYLKLEQTMRIDPLIDILAVGGRVEKVVSN